MKVSSDLLGKVLDVTFQALSEWPNIKDAIYSRPSVVKYLHHLAVVQEEMPDLLIPYIYHLYMGLLSGGQVKLKCYIGALGPKISLKRFRLFLLQVFTAIKSI